MSMLLVIIFVLVAITLWNYLSPVFTGEDPSEYNKEWW